MKSQSLMPILLISLPLCAVSFTLSLPTHYSVSSTQTHELKASYQPSRQHRLPYTLGEMRMRSRSTRFHALNQDLDTIALVAGQENYGLAVVCLGEALWSFAQDPSVSQIKLLLPTGLAVVVLFFVSGPMITSDKVSTVSTGLWIATVVSIGLVVGYVFRLLAPSSSSPIPSKGAAAFGIIVALAGFFSFTQNLIVNDLITLPSLPSLSLPTLTDINIDLGI